MYVFNKYFIVLKPLANIWIGLFDLFQWGWNYKLFYTIQLIIGLGLIWKIPR